MIRLPQLELVFKVEREAEELWELRQSKARYDRRRKSEVAKGRRRDRQSKDVECQRVTHVDVKVGDSYGGTGYTERVGRGDLEVVQRKALQSLDTPELLPIFQCDDADPNVLDFGPIGANGLDTTIEEGLKTLEVQYFGRGTESSEIGDDLLRSHPDDVTFRTTPFPARLTEINKADEGRKDAVRQ